MLCEVLVSEIWSTKPVSVERRNGWKKIMDTLLTMQSPKFDVTIRSVMEHFQIMVRKRKQQDRAEDIASGIIPEVSESDVLLDELIDLFDAAAVDQSAASQHLMEKQAADIAKAEEIHSVSMETLGETRKRRSGERTEDIGGSSRNLGKRAYDIIQEKIKFDVEIKERELNLKEMAVKEKAMHRENVLEEQRKQESERVLKRDVQ